MIPAALVLAIGKELYGFLEQYFEQEHKASPSASAKGSPTVSADLGHRVLLSTNGGELYTGAIVALHEDARSATIRLDTGVEVIASRGYPGWALLPRGKGSTW